MNRRGLTRCSTGALSGELMRLVRVEARVRESSGNPSRRAAYCLRRLEFCRSEAARPRAAADDTLRFTGEVSPRSQSASGSGSVSPLETQVMSWHDSSLVRFPSVPGGALHVASHVQDMASSLHFLGALRRADVMSCGLCRLSRCVQDE